MRIPRFLEVLRLHPFRDKRTVTQVLCVGNNNAKRYYQATIIHFRCKDTQALMQGVRVRRFVAIERAALRKLAQLDAAADLAFLRVPPGNRLEALHGDRAGQYSMHINDQWRLCFVWDNGQTSEVEIVDYH